jgi:diguanylate cyclase (GGDEF)-like protein/PAS domain S-box-containing protein
MTNVNAAVQSSGFTFKVEIPTSEPVMSEKLPEKLPELAPGAPNGDAAPGSVLLGKVSALQREICNSPNFSSITTDQKGIIQIFNKGAQRMLGFVALDVVQRFSAVDLFFAPDLARRARQLSDEFSIAVAPDFDAISYKAARGIEDIFDISYVCKDGSRFPVVVSVTALRDAQDAIIGYQLTSTDIGVRHRSSETLRIAGTLRDAIFNSASFAMMATDDRGVIQIFNQGAQRLLGYAVDDVVNRLTPADLSSHEELNLRAADLQSELGIAIEPGFDAMVFKARRGIEDIFELVYRCKDGSALPVVVSVTALRDGQDAIIGYLLICANNTLRREIDAERARFAQRLSDLQFYTRSLLESSIDALVAINPYGIITDVNKQMELLTACTRDELIGAPFKKFFTDPHRAEIGIKLVLKEHKITDFELTARAIDGRETVVSYNATTYYDRNRRLQGVFVAARDISEHKRAELQLRLALHDKLTGLPNRQLFIDRLQQSMAASQRTDVYGALMFLDLDNFKPLNDAHGHDFGDLLLIEVAQRLKKCAREMDAVARFGGDEFVVMISPLSMDLAASMVQAGIIAEKIRSALSEPYLLTIMKNGDPGKTVEHRCTASIGVAMFLGHQACHEEIIKQADTAMYHAKEAGRNLVRFHEPAEPPSAGPPSAGS